MKIKLLIIIGIIFAQNSYGQLESGNILLGGELSVSSNQFQSRFSVSPTGYFFLSDQFAVGGSIGFTSFRNNPGEDNYERTNSFSISPSARYFWNLSEQAYIYARGTLGFTTSNGKQFVGNVSENSFNGSRFGIGLGTGIMYLLSPRFSVDLGVEIIGVSRNSETQPIGGGQEQTDVSTSFRFGIDTLTPSFGLYYIIK